MAVAIEGQAVEQKGLVFNIQRFTIHDGPGIRTEIFFKGCPLRCKWCSNPESISPKPQLGIYSEKCIGLDKCGLCVKACLNNIEAVYGNAAAAHMSPPLVFSENLIASANRAECPENCFACAEVCPASALKTWGAGYSVDELLEIVLADRNLYRKSGGGVTLSGGEVMLQWEFARELLHACKSNYIHTCVESALHCPQEHMEAVYEYADMVITDIKHMDSAIHKEFAGVGNDLILKNIKRTAEMGKKLIIRIPVVPGRNDDENNIIATGAFVRDILKNKVIQLQLLPYRKLGTDKYESLNQPYPMGEDFSAPERSVWEPRLLHLVGLLAEMNVPAVAGSNVKYTAGKLT